MYQYAFGRYLSIKNNVDLILETYYLDKAKIPRTYGLDIFNIKADICKSKANKDKYNIIKQHGYDFDPSYFNIKDCTYVIGTFQSYKYFQDIESIIFEDFRFKTEPNKYNEEILKEIKYSNSVSIHIRRTDFVNNPRQEVCNINYYLDAIDLINKKTCKPVFYIFSDDLEWPEQNLPINKYNMNFIKENYRNNIAYEDIRLMSNCKHNIIPNSSWAFWGAYLNLNRNKIVICPNKWSNSLNIKINDKVLPSMISLPLSTANIMHP